MPEISTAPRTRTEIKVERPRPHKVLLLNDDFTPRELVVLMLKAVFRKDEGLASHVMMTAH
nr:ATP-dependent Clp protease adaptor ClpS [uncultured Lichenicoccus sp.]